MHAVTLILALVIAASPAAARLAPGKDYDGTLDSVSIAERDSITWAVERGLRDPASAQYSGVHRSPRNPAVLCGMVNAKNAFGGYSGPTPFSVTMIPNGKPSVLNPLSFAPDMRGPLIEAIAAQGCPLRP